MKRYFILGVLLFSLLCNYAQNGALDTSFNATGWKSFSFGKAGNVIDDIGFSVLQQPDGKYIVLAIDSYEDCYLVRFNQNGTIDSSYGHAGFSDQSTFMYGRSAAMQKDGKVVVGGYNYSMGYASIAIARFTTTGLLDDSFGSHGVVSVAVQPNTDSRGQAIAIDSSGRIVIAGLFDYYLPGNEYSTAYVIARLTSAGELDNSFNSTGSLPGTVIVDYHSYNVSLAAIGIQADGKVVVGGSSPYNDNNTFTLARFLSDGDHAGSLDSSFGNGGIVSTTFSDYFSTISTLAIQDDKIIAGGVAGKYNATTDTYNYDIVVTRYLVDGTPDPSFNSAGSFTGTALIDMGGDEYIYSIALRNNRLIAAGYNRNYNSPPGYSGNILLASFKNDGTLDSSFGSDGIVLSHFSQFDIATSVLVQSDGAIVLTGVTLDATADNMDVLLARYNSSGALDESFNATGTQPGVVSFYFSQDALSQFNAVAVQPDSKIIVAGMTYTYLPDLGNTMFAVSRLNPDGTIDNSFGNAGVALADFGSDKNPVVTSVAIDPVTGKIVLGGYVGWYDDVDIHSVIALARFTKEGVLDSSFNADGILLTGINSNPYDSYAIALQNDGKIIVGGTYFTSGNYDAQDFLIARFTSSGAPDAAFGSTGSISIDFGENTDIFMGLTLQPDGKIIAAGETYNMTSGSADFALARLTSDGMPDRKFGKEGKVITSFPGGLCAAVSLAVQPDGKIIASGIAELQDNYDSIFQVVARYTHIGELDKDFGNGGFASVSFWPYRVYSFQGSTVALQNDGKIIVTTQLQLGRIAPNVVNPDAVKYSRYYAVARFSGRGMLDDSWGTSGKLISDFPGETTLNSAIWDNGRLYTVGNFYDIMIRSRRPTGFIAAHTAGERLPYVRINDVVVNETAGNANLMVSMDRASTTPIMIKYATQDNTATFIGPYADYRLARGVITIPAGSTTATISVDILPDNRLEGPESFFVNLSLLNPMSDHAIIADAVGTVTITDGASIPLIKQYTKINNQDNEAVTVSKLILKAMPNPSTGVFNLELQSTQNTPASLRIMDISGRLIESKTGLSPNRSIQVGSNYKPGVYYAEVVQGDEKVIVKLVKQ